MNKKQYIFRAVDPRNDDDIKQYFELKQSLSDFLDSRKKFDENVINWQRWHFGAPEYVFKDEYENKPLPPLEQNADEYGFVCEDDGKIVGFIGVCAYHIIAKQRMDDDIGVISDIFVKEEYRGQPQISMNLLKMAIEKLIECNKFRAICNVQEDNCFRYIHFAMADGNVILKDTCKRRSGNETVDYLLMIDLKKLYNEIVSDKFIKKIGKYHYEMTKEENKSISI